MKFNNNEDFKKYVEQEETKKENFIKTVVSNKHSEEEMSPENAPWADVADFSHAYNYKQIAELSDNLTDEGKEKLEKFAQKQSYETENKKKPEKPKSKSKGMSL